MKINSLFYNILILISFTNLNSTPIIEKILLQDVISAGNGIDVSAISTFTISHLRTTYPNLYIPSIEYTSDFQRAVESNKNFNKQIKINKERICVIYVTSELLENIVNQRDLIINITTIIINEKKRDKYPDDTMSLEHSKDFIKKNNKKLPKIMIKLKVTQSNRSTNIFAEGDSIEISDKEDKPPEYSEVEKLIEVKKRRSLPPEYSKIDELGERNKKKNPPPQYSEIDKLAFPPRKNIDQTEDKWALPPRKKINKKEAELPIPRRKINKEEKEEEREQNVIKKRKALNPPPIAPKPKRNTSSDKIDNSGFRLSTYPTIGIREALENLNKREALNN